MKPEQLVTTIETSKRLKELGMEQKKICNEAYMANLKRGLFQAGSEAILNAPLPSEVERCYSAKEAMEMIEKAYIGGGNNCGRHALKEILIKEYGIKI